MRSIHALSIIVIGVLVHSAAQADQSVAQRLSAAALERTRHEETYDPTYVRIAYPMGDVAPDRGVCADVVVRAYRALGIDLQALVHNDMRRSFGAYPRNWGLRAPDSNIDHRRVPNLEVFFRREGAGLALTHKASDYLPGDIVSWRLDNRLPHIGIVSAVRTPDGTRPLIVHNIGAGPKLEDVLFSYPLAGHFRYLPAL